MAPFYIFSTKSAEEILLIESYQVINDFTYWLKDLKIWGGFKTGFYFEMFLIECFESS